MSKNSEMVATKAAARVKQ
jgi:recombinational DNA repair protein RecR